MLNYLLQRLATIVPTLFFVSVLIFGLQQLLPGDPAIALAGEERDPETVRYLREKFHLDEPVPVRYWYWVEDAVTDQFGTTLLTNKPILPDLWRVMKNTLQLVIVAQMLAILVGVGIGILSALRQYSAFDYSATTFSFLGLATPVFWLGLMLQVLVVYLIDWTGHQIFPIANLSDVNPGKGIDFALDRAHHLVMPVIVLMVAGTATYSRYMRASMLEVINSDYVRTARAKGLNERRVTMRHAFRNALIPVVTLAALDFGTLLGGAIVTETVFSLDGMGLYFINALGTADPYPVMAWLMITATMIIVLNLIADIAYGLLDPRVRLD